MSLIPPKIFPDNIMLRMQLIPAEPQELYPEELTYSKACGEKRRCEFAAGRSIAREALKALGGPRCALPRMESGETQWPENWVGCISHTGDIACAAVGLERLYASIGIDIERCGRMTDAVGRRITLADERRWMARQSADFDWPALFFSAKEAVYKAVFPLQKEFFGFDAVRIHFDPEALTFRAEGCGRSLPSLGGCCTQNGQFTWAGCWIPHGNRCNIKNGKNPL